MPEAISIHLTGNKRTERIPSLEKLTETQVRADVASVRPVTKVTSSVVSAFSLLLPRPRQQWKFHLTRCFPQSHAECWGNSTSGWNPGSWEIPDVVVLDLCLRHIHVSLHTNAYFTPCRHLSWPCRRCELNWRQDKTVLSCLDPISNLQLFSLKYTKDYWKLSRLVASSVHTADTDKTRKSGLVHVGGVKWHNKTVGKRV